MSEWIRLSPTEFFLIWWAMELGEPPVALDLPRPGPTPRQRAEYAAEASDALRERGLGTVHEPARAVATALWRLARAGRTLDLCADGVDGPCLGLGTVDGLDTVVAIRIGDRIHLALVRSEAPAASLLEAVASLPAGRGLPVNVRADDYTTACQEGERTGTPGFVRVLRTSGLCEADAATLARVVTTRTGGGQLGATDHGRRAPTPVTWVDTPAGRYAVRRHGDWVTIGPADRTRLATMAAGMV